LLIASPESLIVSRRSFRGAVYYYSLFRGGGVEKKAIPDTRLDSEEKMVSSPVLYTVLDVYSCFLFWGDLCVLKVGVP
jgi:hypothetical protein